MTYRVWTTLTLVALVAALGTGVVAPRPAQANDAAAIIAGAAVGYLVYRALDNDIPRYQGRYTPSPHASYNPPRGGYYRESPRRWYNRGYGDGWNDGYRTGYDDGSYGYRGGYGSRGSYSPPPAYGGGWCY